MTTPSPLQGWQPIDHAPGMTALWLFQEYYSHGRVRHGYRDKKGEWRGVNADGTSAPLSFSPTHFQPIPSPPKEPNQ